MTARRSRQKKPAQIQRRAPQQRRARATVDAVLEATARIVRREGLAALSTNRIAERAGISVGTLYGYFPDKTAVVVALARRILREDTGALLAALDAGGPSDPLRAIVRVLLARHRTDPVLRRAVMAVHIGEGFRSEHGELVEGVARSIFARRSMLFAGRSVKIDGVRLFVATRAALGVARALAEEADAPELPDATFEDEVLRLVHAYLEA